MELNKCIVTLHAGTDKAEFISDLTRPSAKSAIPAREVELYNARYLDTLCEFFLTKEEIEELRGEERVKGVDIKGDRFAVAGEIRDGTFTMVNYAGTGVKDPADPAYEYDPTVVQSYKQWGFLACGKKSDEPNIVGNPPSSYLFTDNTGYALDGEGVDVVILDDGLLYNHPEFFDENGDSRIQFIDWWTESGVSGTQPAAFYNAGGGHGTPVASVIAGRTQGWAPKAKIYSLVLADLIANGAANGFPGQTTAVELIVGWHKNKGNDRPTIVNMSWANQSFIKSTSDDKAPVGTQAYASTAPSTLADINCAMGVPNTCGPSGWELRYPSPINTAETELMNQLINAGIVVVGGTFNNNFLYPLSTESALYDFYFSHPDLYGTDGSLGGRIYPCRGSFPAAAVETNGCIAVSNAGIEMYESGGKYYFKKNAKSSFGKRIDIFAPGTNILSASWGDGVVYGEYAINFPGSSEFYMSSHSGTSFSTAQVSGILALWAQVNAIPKHLQNANVQKNARKWLFQNAASNALWTADPATSNTVADCCGSGVTASNKCSGVEGLPIYTNSISDSMSSYITAGSPNRFLFNKFSQASAKIDF